jgi:hypothetical protein
MLQRQSGIPLAQGARMNWVGISIVGFIVLCAIGLLVYYITTPIYRIRIKGTDSSTYEDEWVQIDFPFHAWCNLRELKHLDFSLTNKLQNPLTINWDSCAFVDPGGDSCRVVHSGIKHGNTESHQVPSVVAGGADFTDMLLPTDNIHWDNSANNNVGAWKYIPLLEDWWKEETFEFKILLAIGPRDDVRDQEIVFTAQKIRASEWIPEKFKQNMNWK